MSLFNTLFENSNNAIELDAYISENIQVINDFAKTDYQNISSNGEQFNKFIQLRNQTLQELDFKKIYNKAFLSILIELCERLGEQSCLQRIYSLYIDNDINIGERLNAVLLYQHGISANHEFKDRFDDICIKLEFSAENEEDNLNKPVATFLNYFGYVLLNTQFQKRFILEIKEKIDVCIENKSYTFIQHEAILKALEISLDDIDKAYFEIQIIIDDLLGKSDIVSVYYSNDTLLLEHDSAYSKLIPLNITFNSIRTICLRQTDGQALTGRGADILKTDDQLFSYIYRFGNMHKAKLDSAFSFLPDNIFDNDVNIIDWGCGQAIGSMVLADKYGTENVSGYILIEPSEIAIRRASLHLKSYNPELRVKTICKKLDSLRSSDFTIQKGATLHLFSNILDIDDYNQQQLCELISNTQKGDNYFICVSPYIDDRKTDRVDGFRRFFERRFSPSYEFLGESMNSGLLSDTYWNCNNKYKGKMGVYCTHPVCGCDKKWTRVIKVFKVVI